jgi:DNA-binding NarL/FixJ family response regulator
VPDEDTTIRVLIADDHHLFREGLRATLERSGMAVVGETSAFSDVARLGRTAKPDVVVLGLNMPGLSGADAIREILAASPDLQIVVVTAFADGEDAVEALAAGAGGHLGKDMAPEELAGGIRQAASGSAVLSAAAMSALVGHVRANGRPEEEIVQALRSLTARELEVLRLIVAGADNAQIGSELSISPHTVKHYVTNILEKLGVRSRVEAAVRAVRGGLA